PLPITDLSSAVDAEIQVQMVVQEEADRPFDLAQDLPIRAMLIRLTEAEHILQLTLSNVVSDGWSMGLLLREWSALYGAFSKEQAVPSGQRVIQCADFAIRQPERLQGKVLEAHLGFWKRYLDGAPQAVELPTDRPRPHRLTQQGEWTAFELSAE